MFTIQAIVSAVQSYAVIVDQTGYIDLVMQVFVLLGTVELVLVGADDEHCCPPELGYTGKAFLQEYAGRIRYNKIKVL